MTPSPHYPPFTPSRPRIGTLLAKALCWQAALWLLALLSIFMPAGTLTWSAGWIFFMLFFGFVGWLSLWLLRVNPSLLQERLVFLRRDQPLWDRVWLPCFYALSVLWLALMPLDAVRLHASRVPAPVQIIGFFLMVCALAGIFVTIRENHYLSPLVRVQHERGHALISTGPYRFLRHPLYASAFVFYTGVPLLLGSWMAFACAPIFIGLLSIRARLEERLLQRALPGYDAYMQYVRFRFLPSIW